MAHILRTALSLCRVFVVAATSYICKAPSGDKKMDFVLKAIKLGISHRN